MQRKFLEDAKKRQDMPWDEFAVLIETNPGTLKSYTNQLCTLPMRLFKKICEICSWKIDKTLTRYRGRKISALKCDFPFQKGYRLGKARIKTKNFELKKDEGRLKLNLNGIEYSRQDKEKKIIFPKWLDENLAEEIGIHLGDGFLSNDKYDFRVKGDKSNEIDYYDNHLKKLYKILYNINIENRDYIDSYGFEIYSKALWEFKVNSVGITPGKKDKINIPKILSKSNKRIKCAFLRGIMDTDGSILFKARYGYANYYPTISLTCKSRYLAEGVYKMFKTLGFAPKFYKKSNGVWDVYLYGYSNFDRYQRLVGWRNPKNLNKIREWNTHGLGGVMVARKEPK